MSIIDIFSLIAFVILLAVGAWVASQAAYIFFRNRAPYVASQLRPLARPLTDILLAYVPRPSHVAWYELGGGRALVTQFVTKHFAFHTVRVIELNWLLVMLLKLSIRLRKKTIDIIHGDVLDQTYRPNSVLYCYLFDELLESLYKAGKFNDQLVISLSFPIPNVQPTQTTTIKGMQKRLYVYDFRTSTFI